MFVDDWIKSRVDQTELCGEQTEPVTFIIEVESVAADQSVDTGRAFAVDCVSCLPDVPVSMEWTGKDKYGVTELGVFPKLARYVWIDGIWLICHLICQCD